MKHLLLKHHLASGDSLVMTSAVESLHSQYPGQYLTSVDTTCMAIWHNNPHIVPINNDAIPIQMKYPAINRSDKPSTGHFMNAFCKYLGEVLEIEIPLSVDRPYIYLSQNEINEGPSKFETLDFPYMVINAGYKNDYTTKNWGHHNYQKLVDLTKHNVVWVQVGHGRDNHKPLKDVVNLIDKTSSRDLFKLCYHSIGGVGPTTFLQHVMASLNKWYGCLLGGREAVSWCWYPSQTVFHTHGQLYCCQKRSCWKSRTVPLNDGQAHDVSLCHLPVIKEDTIPACMDSILPEQVASAVLNVVKNGKAK